MDVGEDDSRGGAASGPGLSALPKTALPAGIDSAAGAIPPPSVAPALHVRRDTGLLAADSSSGGGIDIAMPVPRVDASSSSSSSLATAALPGPHSAALVPAAAEEDVDEEEDAALAAALAASLLDAAPGPPAAAEAAVVMHAADPDPRLGRGSVGGRFGALVADDDDDEEEEESGVGGGAGALAASSTASSSGGGLDGFETADEGEASDGAREAEGVGAGKGRAMVGLGATRKGRAAAARDSAVAAAPVVASTPVAPAPAAPLALAGPPAAAGIGGRMAGGVGERLRCPSCPYSTTDGAEALHMHMLTACKHAERNAALLFS